MTLNIVNGKRYIGKRTYTGTNILNDSYLGSGTVLKKALNKYGADNFKKIIIAVCDTELDAYGYEKTLIDQLGAVHSKEYYNLIGGHDSIQKVDSKDVQIILLDTTTGQRVKCNKTNKNTRTKKVIKLVNKILEGAV